MQVSPRRGGVYARFQNMNVIVTVIRLEKEQMFFVLAAHPCFVGSDFVESDARRLIEDECAPIRERRWHWTAHRHRLKPQRKGRAGAYKADAETLAQAFEAMETDFEGRLRDLASKDRSHPNQCARAFRKAFKGGYSKDRGWAWLKYPQGHPACRTLWLTRRPGQNLEDSQGLLLHSPLGAVDSAIASMRRRMRSLGRPAFRARPGRSYAESYVDLAAVIHELWACLLLRNYSLRQVTAQKIPLAKALKLLRPHAIDKRRGRVIGAAVGFRLGAEQ